MTNFSYSRFCLILRRDLAEHRRTYLAFFGILVIAHTLIHFFGNLINEPAPPLERFTLQMFFNSGVFVLGSCYAMSLIYAHIDSKEHRISNFMLPASNFEKALVRHLLAIVGFWGIYLASYLCSEVIQALYITVSQGWTEVAKHSLLANLIELFKYTTRLPRINVLDELDEFTKAMPWVLLSVHILATSLFTLGSAFFRKKAFIKVMLIMFILNPGLLLSPLAKYHDGCFEYAWVTMTYAFIILALSVVALYLAYRRYCRLQVL